MTAGTDRAGVVVDERVLDAATLLGEGRRLRDVRALLELTNDPANEAAVSPGLRFGRATDERSLARADPAAADGTRLRGCTRDMPARATHGNSLTRGIGCRFFIFQIRSASSARTTRCLTRPLRNNWITSWSLRRSSRREGSNIAEADAFSYIAGFTIFNDWSCRDLQRDEMAARLGPAKGKDSASSLGPWIVHDR